MSVLSRQGRITVKLFVSVPPLHNLPANAIQRVTASVSNASSRRGTEHGIDI
jgi:hypothetical protein